MTSNSALGFYIVATKIFAGFALVIGLLASLSAEVYTFGASLISAVIFQMKMQKYTSYNTQSKRIPAKAPTVTQKDIPFDRDEHG